MSKTTDIIKAAARTAADTNASTEDRQAAERILDTLDIAPGDEVLIQTVTIYWSGVVVRVTADEIILVDATSVIQTGEYAPALKSFKWMADETLGGNSIVRIKQQGIMAIIRKGGS